MSLLDTSARIIDLKITYQCNNRCLFCIAGDKRTVFEDAPAGSIRNVLKDNSGNRDTVIFTGGEPTIRNDLPELVRFAGLECGYENIVIQTNGRRFAYRNYARMLIEAGANQFMVSVHGHTSALHEYLTGRTGSFAESLLGIKNLIDEGRTVATNTVITKPGYRNLPQVATILDSLGVRQMQFSFPHIDGKARANVSGVVPRMSLTLPFCVYSVLVPMPVMLA